MEFELFHADHNDEDLFLIQVKFVIGYTDYVAELVTRDESFSYLDNEHEYQEILIFELGETKTNEEGKEVIGLFPATNDKLLLRNKEIVQNLIAFADGELKKYKETIST